MFRYLPILAVVAVVLNIVLVIYRLNHLAIDTLLSDIAWALLIVTIIALLWYTWHKANNIRVTSMIMWTFGLVFIPVLIIPWWFLRVYPNLKGKIS